MHQAQLLHPPGCGSSAARYGRQPRHPPQARQSAVRLREGGGWLCGRQCHAVQYMAGIRRACFCIPVQSQEAGAYLQHQRVVLRAVDAAVDNDQASGRGRVACKGTVQGGISTARPVLHIACGDGMAARRVGVTQYRLTHSPRPQLTNVDAAGGEGVGCDAVAGQPVALNVVVLLGEDEVAF